MSEALTVASNYFELSNKSDFEAIYELMTEHTTYSSQNTGLYLGKDDIIAMQREFHESFKGLNWQVNSIKEVKPGIVLFDYTFLATKQNGEEVQSAGLEYVIVSAGKIQHIEIRSRP